MHKTWSYSRATSIIRTTVFSYSTTVNATFWKLCSSVFNSVNFWRKSHACEPKICGFEPTEVKLLGVLKNNFKKEIKSVPIIWKKGHLISAIFSLDVKSPNLRLESNDRPQIHPYLWFIHIIWLKLRKTSSDENVWNRVQCKFDLIICEWKVLCNVNWWHVSFIVISYNYTVAHWRAAHTP